MPNVGTSPPVNRLVVVSDDGDVPMPGAELLDELKLRAVRVLVLVDENEIETTSIGFEHIRILAKHLNGKNEQVVESHSVGSAQRALELEVDFGC